MQNNILTDHRSKRNVQQTCWECSQKLRMNMRDKVSSRISAITFKLSIFWLYGTKGWAEEMTLEVGMPLILTGACRRVMLHLYHLRVKVFCLGVFQILPRKIPQYIQFWYKVLRLPADRACLAWSDFCCRFGWCISRVQVMSYCYIGRDGGCFLFWCLKRDIAKVL